MRPNVVVLMACYDGMRWLPEQVASILSQRGVDVRLVVSVDRSSDGTESWIDELAAVESRIEVLPHGNCFGSAASNFFRLVREAEVSPGDYVAFSDQDDVWLPDKLLRSVAMLKQHQADGYSANVTAWWPDGSKTLVHKSRPQKEWDFLFESSGPGCTFVMRHECFDAFRHFVRLNHEPLRRVALHDWTCYAFARASGMKWYIDPEPHMLYRQHDGNTVGVNKGLSAMRSRANLVLDGWWLDQARLIASLLKLAEDPFVQPWIVPGRRRGAWHLIRNVNRCRRNPREALFMGGLLCWALLFRKSGR